MGFISSKEELGIGAIVGLGFFWAIGPWCLVLAVVTAILWERGGSGWMGTKAWRRLGVPITIALFVTRISIWTLIPLAISVGILSIGYGSRSTQPPDEGSPLGNLWLDALEDEELAKWASRATIVCGIWAVWAVGSIF